jgi:peptidyl-tRNA hydrolase, PTH2 family
VPGRAFLVSANRYDAAMKQVLVVNSSLALPPGKLAAQVAHASIGAFLSAAPGQQRSWLEAGMPKIVLDGATAEFIADLQQRAQDAGLPAFLVRDAGKTVVAAGTVTCLGIGPAPVAEIDALTGALSLLK